MDTDADRRDARNKQSVSADGYCSWPFRAYTLLIRGVRDYKALQLSEYALVRLDVTGITVAYPSITITTRIHISRQRYACKFTGECACIILRCTTTAEVSCLRDTRFA